MIFACYEWAVTTYPESGAPSSLIDAAIRRAITERKLLQFSLDGGTRVAEPHDYGVRKGKAQLLVYQLSGASRSGRLPDWRWVDLSRATDFRVLERSFADGRNDDVSKHSTWERLFLRVEAAPR